MTTRVSTDDLDAVRAVVRDLATQHSAPADGGWPMIAKPRIGSFSAGLVRLEGPTDLAAVCFDAEPLLVQEYFADARAMHSTGDKSMILGSRRKPAVGIR
jgi:glutathione synthase/RimK-type ligase-like ATP-grasp enzyme